MALLGKDQILGAEDSEYRDVPVPEWGGTVRIMGISGTGRDAHESSFFVFGTGGKIVGKNFKNSRARLLALTLVDEDGQRLFTEKDITALGAKSGKVLDRLYDIAKELSGLTEAAVEAKAGNSEPGESDSSTSD